jgi:hypothetical protein
MNNIICVLIATYMLALCACSSNAEKSEMSISTTVSNDNGKVVRKEVFAIKENSNGNMIDLKAENGQISSLSIDGKEIAKEDFSKYETITQPILKKLPTPPSPPDATVVSSDDNEEDNMDKVIEKELTKDGFISDGKVKYDFDLSHKELIINGKIQPEDMKKHYLDLFKNETGKELGTKFHIKLSEDRR